MTTGISYNYLNMPWAGDDGAPKELFNGEPSKLRGLVRRMDQLRRKHGLNDEQAKEWLCNYAEEEEADVWRNMTEYLDAAISYTGFRDAVMAKYPGAQDGPKFSRYQIEELVTTWRAKGIRSESELGEATRKFEQMRTLLVKRKLISDREANLLYLQLFDGDLGNRIQRRLEVKLPDVTEEETYDYKEVN